MALPLPWFPFYVNDFEFDEAVRLMSNEEIGILVRLMCWQWREGSIPHDPRLVSRSIVKAPVAAVRKVLQRCFRDDGTHTGRLVNARLAELRVNQLTKAGKNSAAARGWKTTEERYLYAAEATFYMRTNDGPEISQRRIKIGWSRNPKSRIRAIGREARLNLNLIGMRAATISLERKAHEELALHKEGGEWFRDVPAVRQWLDTNGITAGNTAPPSGNSNGGTGDVPAGETSVRSRIRSQIQKSLSASAPAKATA